MTRRRAFRALAWQAGLAIAPGVPAGPGDRTYTQVGVTPAPTSITVRSSSGGTVSIPVTIR